LAPNATEIVFALGKGATVVGVSRYDDYPAEAASLPRVGGMIDPSFEAIIALRPDALIGARGPANRAVIDRLEQLGVEIVFPPVESLSDIRAAIRTFATLVGADHEAAALIARIDAQIAHVRGAASGRTPPSVLAVFGQRPITVAGPGSFADELIALANGRNVVRTGDHWPTLALEAVLALAPEVVLDLTSMEQHDALATMWASYTAIPAVRDGRVIAITDEVALRPGPRVGEALAIFARALHPGIALSAAASRAAREAQT
jgi:iron complex transport system substrate-binding protein